MNRPLWFGLDNSCNKYATIYYHCPK